MATWKSRLRRFVVRTSSTPLVWIYRRMYGLAIWLAVLGLRRYRTIEAVYLTRGCAKSDIRPGISDIDLVVVTSNESSETDSIQGTLRGLSRMTAGVVEHYPNQVQSVEALEHRWRTSPLWQYRLHEGKRHWKVLCGTDLLGALSDLTDAQRMQACYAEMARWWILFAHEMAKTDQPHSDLVMHNVACYKAVSELLSLDSAMQTGEPRRPREESLERSDTPLSRKLKEIATQNFLFFDHRLMEETLDFLLTFYTDRFSKLPWSSTPPENSVDFESNVNQIREQTVQDMRVLGEYLRVRWSDKCLDTQGVRGASWASKDLLFIISIDERRLPTVRDIAGLIREWKRLQNEEIFLFLRCRSVAFPLTPVIPQDLHRGLLTPVTAPEVFLQLGHSLENDFGKPLGRTYTHA